MVKPHIYGDEGRFRAAVNRGIRSGEDLAGQTDGVRRRMELAGDRLDALLIEQEWERDFRRWFMATGGTLAKYLQDQLVPTWARRPPAGSEEALLPVFAAGLPPDTGKPRHVIHINEGVEWLQHALQELRELRSILAPTSRPPRTQKVVETVATPRGSRLRPSWWKLGTAGSVASLVGVPLAVASIVLAILFR
jgi:hypothetical protein